MNINTRAQIEGAYRTLERVAQDRKALVADPHGRTADQVAALDALDARAQDAIRRATEGVQAEGAKVQAAYRRSRKTSYDETAVGAAWTRIEKLLDRNAEGLDEVISRFGQPGYGREAAEAIRQNLSTRKTIAMEGSGREENDRAVAADLERVERGELSLMPYDERVATEAELDRRGADAALKSLQRAAATVRAPALSRLPPHWKSGSRWGTVSP